MNECNVGGCGEWRKSVDLAIKELKESDKKQNDEITDIKTSQAETKVYIKQILERVDDLKVLFTVGNNSTNDKWVKVVIELIKSIGTVGAIIAGIKILG